MTSRLLKAGVIGATAIACGRPAPTTVPTTAPTTPATAGAAPTEARQAPPAVQVTVTHPSADRFHVVYALPEPRARLDLERNGSGVRAHWAPVDAKLVHDGDHDAILASAPRTKFEVDLPVDDVQPEKDYRNFYTFTDGARLLYTGHLAAASFSGNVTFVGGAGESVVVHGFTPGPTATIPMQIDGTYVYFGAAKPLATDDFVGMVDPGFPSEVRAAIDSLTPQLFKIYADGLGRPAAASEKPLLFATYAKHGPGVSIGGGVMPPRVVNFGFEFAEDPTPKWVLQQIEYTIAHESAHLWNADLYRSESSWIREGTADALAYDTLRKLGRLDEKDYLGMLSNTVSLCIASLSEGEPFSKATRPGHYKEVYFCGHTLALFSEAAAKEPLVPLLKDVYAGPNNEYDENRYIEVLAAKDANAAAFVTTFVKDKLADPTHDLPNALKRVGIGIGPASKLGGYYEQAVGGYALRAVVDPKCLAALELEGDFGQAVTVKAPGACGEMVPGDSFASLAGAKYPAKAADGWDAAIAQCKKGGVVSVGRNGKPDAKIPCAKAPRARPQYVEVTKAP